MKEDKLIFGYFLKFALGSLPFQSDLLGDSFEMKYHESSIFDEYFFYFFHFVIWILIQATFGVTFSKNPNAAINDTRTSLDIFYWFFCYSIFEQQIIEILVSNLVGECSFQFQNRIWASSITKWCYKIINETRLG